jgi:capsular exopolysaccharide synthesis family protein
MEETRLATTDPSLVQDGDGDGDYAAQPLSRVVASRRGVEVEPHREHADAGGMKIALMAHQALRGRYLFAIVLGLVAGVLFGAAGWLVSKPVYQSEGLIRIANSLPVAIEQTDQNQPLGSMLDTFVMSQRLLITSRRCVELAVQQPVWKVNGVPVPADPHAFYAEQMKVDVRPRSEYIQIAVTDRNPATAAAAVTAIINAYQEIYKEQEKQQEDRRTSALEAQQFRLQAQAKDLNTQLQTEAHKFGAIRIDTLYENATQRLNRMETALADVRMAVASAESSAPAAPIQAAAATPGAPAQPVPQAAQQALPAATQPAAQTPEQIAAHDPVMRGYLDTEAQLQAELNRMITVNRLGEAHRDVVAKKLSLEEHRARIARYAKTAIEFQSVTAQPLIPAAPGSAPVVTAGRSLETLKQNEKSLAKLCEDTRSETVNLGNSRLAMQRLETELQTRQEELSRLNRRIEVLRAEGSLGGRLSVVSTGGIPIAPQRDVRLRLAGAGALAGASLPVSLILLASLVWRKYRYSDETEADIAQSAPLLGILPELKKAETDGERPMSAAHSVHQIRVSLQSQAAGLRHDGSRTYLVTSATAGEGKTTIATSLGLSFAAARLRTLVIDADLVGRHMTDAMNARDLQGLNEALAAGTIRGRVRKTAAGLYVMTAGKASGPDACSVAPSAVRSLLEECRTHFNVIIIDSGPILGSLEAAILAQEVDGVVLTISRGQQRELVQKAMQRVRSLGGLVVGFIFNRAKPQDFHRSSYTAVSRADVADAVVASEPAWDAESLTRFGPVVRAVASGFPAAQA